jgi:hypothetical protein
VWVTLCLSVGVLVFEKLETRFVAVCVWCAFGGAAVLESCFGSTNRDCSSTVEFGCCLCLSVCVLLTHRKLDCWAIFFFKKLLKTSFGVELAFCVRLCLGATSMLHLNTQETTASSTPKASLQHNKKSTQPQAKQTILVFV